MTIIEPAADIDLLYQHAQQCLQDSLDWFPEVTNIPFHTLALCGEVGELANIVKKIERGSLKWEDPEVQIAFKSEIADIYTYLMGLVALSSTDLKAAYEMKREFNANRFGKKD